MDAGQVDRSQQEGRGESGGPHLILCFPSRSGELVYLTTGLGEQEGLLKNHQICCPSFQRWFQPTPGLHPECQLLKTIALLHHIDYSRGCL